MTADASISFLGNGMTTTINVQCTGMSAIVFQGKESDREEVEQS